MLTVLVEHRFYNRINLKTHTIKAEESSGQVTNREYKFLKEIIDLDVSVKITLLRKLIKERKKYSWQAKPENKNHV